ncbi:MAG: flagellar basal body L-ring protein FlgH [Candidatus Gastranaerophilales bacterium]|nr:flagellar basal body L-ring protein FlgH [Candidatus Gastranaerophilales bacterium]
MKKVLFLLIISGFITQVNAESLFSLNASQSALIEPRALYSSVRARGVGDLVSIVIDEAPAMTDNGTYSTEKTSSLAENFTNAFNQIFKTKLKGALNGTNGNLSVDGSTQVSRNLTLSDTVVAQVVQVLPNGNLLVQGKKSLVNQNERVDLIISGIVDPKWINQSGEINSSHVANLQFAMNGAGTVSRGQNEGVLDRAIRTLF